MTIIWIIPISLLLFSLPTGPVAVFGLKWALKQTFALKQNSLLPLKSQFLLRILILSGVKVAFTVTSATLRDLKREKRYFVLIISQWHGSFSTAVHYDCFLPWPNGWRNALFVRTDLMNWERESPQLRRERWGVWGQPLTRVALHSHRPRPIRQEWSLHLNLRCHQETFQNTAASGWFLSQIFSANTFHRKLCHCCKLTTGNTKLFL